ncbi:hypothetical protein QYF61_017176 [Mycteria americana]|uniref:ribonuclease H n=1 Tax=Mycteria americana TaxID=33587 RepID=A0AAN7MUP3_MYCAM|nr:hypothetical protein QYF61_017176 [Mycteria americana]
MLLGAALFLEVLLQLVVACKEKRGPPLPNAEIAMALDPRSSVLPSTHVGNLEPAASVLAHRAWEQHALSAEEGYWLGSGPAKSTVNTPRSMRGNGEEREKKPIDTVAKPDTVSVTPITKKKQWKWKSARLVRDEEASPKREQEKESEEAVCSAAEQSQEQEQKETEIINETETTPSLSLSELRDMQKDFSHQPAPWEYKALVNTGAQCTPIPSEYKGAESICISGVTGGSQELSVLEAEVSLTGNEWQKHPVVTGLEAPCTLGIDCLRRGYFKDPKGYWTHLWWGCCELKNNGCQLLPCQCTSDNIAPIETPWFPSITEKYNGDGRLTVDYRGLNKVTLPLSAAVPDMLELQYELESKAAKWYATTDIANAFFLIPLAAECRPQFAFTWRGIQYTCNRLPQGWKHSPTICHGSIQSAMEQGEAPEHLQYVDDITVAEEVFEKGRIIIQIILKADFAIKQSKVKGPAQEIQFLGIKWQHGCHQIPVEVINKITAMSPPTNKKETQAFLGVLGFWRMHIPNYSLIVSPLYRVTQKKNDFEWGPEQQQAFEQIKWEIHFGPAQRGQDVKNVLYTSARDHGPTWNLWQKAPGETRRQPLGFWSQGYRGSEARYTPAEEEILVAYQGIQAASEVVGTEAQLLLAPRLPVLGCIFKGRIPSTHHATDARWSQWVTLITQQA